MLQKSFSVILSDMCPPVSGITIKDSAISTELGMRALDIAVGSSVLAQAEDNSEEGSVSCPNDKNDNGVLQKGGHLVIKLLESEDMQGAFFFFFFFSSHFCYTSL